jgi:hypothetical protein
VEANASIAKHRTQMKEGAANGESSKGRHVTHCGTGSRRYDFEQERDHYNCDRLVTLELEFHARRRQCGPDTPPCTVIRMATVRSGAWITRQSEVNSARTAASQDVV